MIIYHNPRCSKSRNALEIINNFEHHVVFYINDPLSRDELISLISRLEGPLHELIRWSDAEAPAKPENVDVDFVINQLIDNPKIMQRPIIDDGSRAAICRMTENVLTFL